MSALGSLSPLAYPLGGGTSHVEDIYRALRSAPGTSVGPEDGLDDLWRQSRAVGIGSAHLALDKAAYQALPDGTTDHLAAYERGLGLASSSAQTEQDRRLRVAAAWTSQIASTSRGIERDLQDISANYSLRATDHDLTDTTHHGRSFPAFGLEATYGVSAYPNYGTSFVVTVVYAVPAGVFAIPDAELDDGERLLNSALPAHVDYVVSQEGTSGAGFYADGGPDGTSVADLTAIY